jgi:hypothetical protein
MAKTSTKQRNVLTVAVIIIVFVVASIAFLIVFYQPSTANRQVTKLRVNFSLNQTEVIQGNDLQAQVNVTSIGQAENITLSANSSSSGISCTFQPSNGISNFTSMLTCYVPDSTPTGNYSFTVMAWGNQQEENASFVVPVLSANVTVSGQAYVSGALTPIASIQTIEFTDTQTGNVTTFHFPYLPQSDNRFGNYLVSLKNGHTYNVTINYIPMTEIDNPEAYYIGTFTVNAPAGETAITGKDFI